MRIFSLLLLIVLPVALYGQAVTTGTITGTTRDQTGASIPGVNLTLTNSATGSVLRVVSDDTGTYRFLSIPSASGYDLKAELPGFRVVSVSEITVRPGGSQRFDLTLQVGEVAEEVTVTADAPLINAESSQVSEGLGQVLTKNLPLAKREFAEIAVLFQGIQQNPKDNSGTFTQFHARGMPTASNAYRVDGANVVWTPGGRVGLRMTATAVEQYEFIAGGFSAEYGEQAGSVINLTTKSGANQTAWAYTFLNKPSALTSNLNSGLANQVNKKGLGEAHFQEFSIGGAIIKDRLFYHNSFQWQDEKLGNLVTPKRGEKFFTSERMKITYNRTASDRWDISFDSNPSMQHFNGYNNADTSLESDSQQRVQIFFGAVKNTRTFHTNWVTETQSSIHGVNNWSPSEARLPWSPRGMYRGPLRTKDFVNVQTPTGTYTTGPKANWGSSAWKRFRLSEKLVRQSGSHNLRFGGEYGFNFGDYAEVTYFVRSFTDQRPIGRALNRNDNISKRVDQNAHEVIMYFQDGWKIARHVLLEAGVRMDGQQRGKSGLDDANNVVPRLGLTFDPSGTGRNRFFANWGLYHEFLSGGDYTFGENTLATLLYRVDNPDANFNGTLVLLNTFSQVKAAKLFGPTVNSWSAGFEQMMPGQIKVGITYAGNRQHRRLTGLRTTTQDFRNPDGRASYRALEMNWRRAFKGGFELAGNYTRSRTMADQQNVLTVAQRPYRYAYADWHEPHAARVLAMMDVWGFTITPVFRLDSGRPHSINNPGLGTDALFVDKDGKPAGRNIYKMPNNWTLDVTLVRTFSRESYSISPTIQFLNLTNHVNVYDVSSNFFSPGRPTNVGDSRQLQLGVDVRFGK